MPNNSTQFTLDIGDADISGDSGVTILTESLIMAGQSCRGGWSAAQLVCLGVMWPPKKGWKRAIIGTAIPSAQISRFLALRDVVQPRTKSKKRNRYK